MGDVCRTLPTPNLHSNTHRFIYGGFHLGDINSFGLDKVYILTLPAFQWVETPATGGTVRSGHHCQIIGQRQMLSIGGHGNDFDSQDPWTSGMGIFDMTKLTWGFNYDAKAAPYTPPSLVTNYYNASSRFPVFNNASLAAIINVTTTGASVSLDNSTSIPSATNTSTTSGENSNTPITSQRLNTGAIVGGIVGGVVVVILLTVFGYLVWRRRQKRQVKIGTTLKSETSSVSPAQAIGLQEMDEQPWIAELNAGLRPEMDEQRRTVELNGSVVLEIDGTGIATKRSRRG